MSIRVLVISDYRKYHSTRGEAEIFKTLANRGFEICIMTFKQGRHIQEFEAAKIKVIDFHPVKRLARSEIKFIRAFAKDWKPNIAYLFNSRSILNGIQALKRLPIKIVLYRGLSANVSWYDPTMYLKFYHPCVDKIVCNSIGVEEEFRKQRFLNFDKLVTINKGHRLSWYQIDKEYPIRKELGLKESSLILFTVAVNRKMKGIPVLLKAMTILPKELDLVLLLIGSNMDDKSNLKCIEKYNLDSKVKILAYREDVLRLVAAGDVKILPSISGESITKAVIEAMACAKPAIISDIRGNVELVKHGYNGFVFESQNSKQLAEMILKIYRDPKQRITMGQEAKRYVQDNLHIDQTIDQTEALFKKMMNSD